MKKAVLSNRIFLSADKELEEKINTELTYWVPARNPKDPPVPIKQMSRVKEGLLSIPIGRTDLIPEGYEIVEKRVEKPIDFPDFKFELREDQLDVYKEVNDNVIVNAQPSWGKTFTGIAIATKLGQKTLIVCHTVQLMNQWIKEVKKTLGITPGQAGSGVFNLDAPIVIGSVRTLYNHMPKIVDEFGTVILDEMHHVSSKTFSSVVDKSRARYKIGLSATVERKDGRHVVFKDYFSSHMIRPKEANAMPAVVHRFKPDIRIPGGAGIPWATRMTELAYDPDYQDFICFLTKAYIAKGHKVLVLGDRLHLLNVCHERLQDQSVVITGDVTDLDERDRLIDLTKSYADALFGTQSIFSEGFSEKHFSCLIMASPVNNDPLLEQLCGRIQRKMEGKKNPVVVDIQLKGHTGKKQAIGREGFYLRKGWKVKTFE